MTALAGAFDAAADQGIYHGAVEPGDVMFLPGSSSVSGFGITQAAREAGLEANDPSRADDIYALAAMAFELLTGKRYDGGDVRSSLIRTLSNMPADRFGVLADTIESTLGVDPDLVAANGLGVRRTARRRGAAWLYPEPPASDEQVGRLAFGNGATDDHAGSSDRTKPARHARQPEPQPERPPLELTLFETPELLFQTEEGQVPHPAFEPLPDPEPRFAPRAESRIEPRFDPRSDLARRRQDRARGVDRLWLRSRHDSAAFGRGLCASALAARPSSIQHSCGPKAGCRVETAPGSRSSRWPWALP